MNYQDLNTELGILNAKRSALEQGLHIAALIERLNRSLSATLIARRPAGSLPVEALQYYEKLDELSRALPAPLLKIRIANLRQEVQEDFHHILFVTRLVKGEDGGPGSGSRLDDVDLFLGRFADHSARLVGMRVSLFKKGENSEPLELSIPTEVLSRRLDAVSDLERHCRSKIRSEIKTLRNDARQMLNNRGMTESVRQELQEICDDLQTCLLHIETGGDISDIPVLIQTLSWDPSPMSTAELSDLLRAEEVEEIAVEEITIAAPTEAPEPAFRDTLHYWLNTPLDVSWDTVKQWQKKTQTPGRG